MSSASCFRIVSIGLVAENKGLNSKVISATPIESLNLSDGELRSKPVSMESKGVDQRGVNYGTNISVDNVVEATWLPFGSNRSTAPDVRRGMRVYLWASQDADKYYWTSAGLDDRLMKLETVVWAFSATIDEAVDSTSFGNCYFLEMSTHNKSVTFQTSTANNEPFAYTMQFNTAEGVVVLQDDVGNMFEMDSAEKRLSLHNASNSKIDVDKGKIKIVAPEEVSIEVGGTKMVWTPGGTTLKTPKFDGSS